MGWLMAGVSNSAQTISYLQVASSAAIAIFALIAGAIADTWNRRSIMTSMQVVLLIIAFILGVLVSFGSWSPAVLICMTFSMSVFQTIHLPSWMRTVPDVLPKEQIPTGVVLNSTAVNVARLAGPLVAGYLISQFTPSSAFFINAVTFGLFAWQLSKWHPAESRSNLPSLGVSVNLLEGLRYLLYSPGIFRLLTRQFLYGVPASALLTLLPLLLRREIRLEPFEYTLALSAMGAGAVAGATILVSINKTLTTNRIVAVFSVLLSLTLLMLGKSDLGPALYLVMFIAGGSWLAVISSFGVAMGSSVPAWVLSRALSFHMVCFQIAMALGALIWGVVADQVGVMNTYTLAGIASLLGCLIAVTLPILPSAPSTLAPAMQWPNPPEVVDQSMNKTTLVQIDYEVEGRQLEAFREVMATLSQIRLRNGAFRWGLFQVAEIPGRYVEIFWVGTWAEHLHQHNRSTTTDESVERVAKSFRRPGTEIQVRHLIAEQEGGLV